MPNVMAALPNIGGALCSTPQHPPALVLPVAFGTIRHYVSLFLTVET